MSEPTDREAQRARALRFLHSPRFGRYYERAHIPRRDYVRMSLLQCLSVIGIPVAVRALIGMRNRQFPSEDLRRRYAALEQTGRVVEGQLVINNVALHGNPSACAPALVLADLEGTDAGDERAHAASGEIVERLFLEKASSDLERRVARLIADEVYQDFRRRELPREFTGGRSLHFLDVMIDNELLEGGDLFRAGRLYFLVDPAPGGPVLLIPQSEVA